MNFTEIFKKIVIMYLMMFVFLCTSASTMIVSTQNKESKEATELKKSFKWMNEDIYRIITKNCKKYGLDVVLVCSVIQYESGEYCNNNLEKMLKVRSYAGARGICQIMPFHVKDPRTLEDPNVNIEKSCWYLSLCVEKAKSFKFKFKNVYAEACRMYNSGTNAKRWRYKNWNYAYKICRMYQRVNIELENNKRYLADI